MDSTTNVLGPGSFKSEKDAAALPNGGHEEKKQQSGAEGLTGPLAQDVYSDSVSDVEEAEELLAENGGNLGVYEDDLESLRDPKDFDIMLFFNEGESHNYKWMASAPQWSIAFGFGSSTEKASRDLQSQLVAAKKAFIDGENGEDISYLPVVVCTKRAIRQRKGGCKHYYDDLEKEASAVIWRKIWV